MYSCFGAIVLQAVVEDKNGNIFIRAKSLQPDLELTQDEIDIKGPLAMASLTPQRTRRSPIPQTGATGILRAETFLVQHGDLDFQAFDLGKYYCNGNELVEPAGLGNLIVQLIVCNNSILAVKYQTSEYSLEKIFKSQFRSSAPVVLTIDEISTVVYVAYTEEGAYLFHRLLTGEGVELPLYSDDENLEESFGFCVNWETSTHSHNHILISCPSKNNNFLVGLIKEQNREVTVRNSPAFNFYDEDMYITLDKFYVTIYTNGFESIHSINTPSSIIVVDYVRIEEDLILILVSHMHIFKLNTSLPYVDENLELLVTVTVLCLTGECQSYLIYETFLAYTFSDNGLNTSRVVNIVTGEHVGSSVYHQYSPLLYNIVYNNDSVPMVILPTSTTDKENISSSMTSLEVINATITYSSSNETTDPIPENHHLIILYTVPPCAFILLVIIVIVLLVVCCNRSNKFKDSFYVIIRRNSPSPPSSEESSISNLQISNPTDPPYFTGLEERGVQQKDALVNDAFLFKFLPSTTLSENGYDISLQRVAHPRSLPVQEVSYKVPPIQEQVS